jgi:hypothetical protein
MTQTWHARTIECENRSTGAELVGVARIVLVLVQSFDGDFWMPLIGRVRHWNARAMLLNERPIWWKRLFIRVVLGQTWQKHFGTQQGRAASDRF